MSRFSVSFIVLLATFLTTITHAHPQSINNLNTANTSLLLSKTLSPNYGWADEKWETVIAPNLTLTHYNGGPCANGIVLQNFTFINGTQSNATLLDVYEQYDTAFDKKNTTARDEAIAHLKAQWQPLADMANSTLYTDFIKNTTSTPASPTLTSDTHALARRLPPFRPTNRNNLYDLAIVTAALMTGGGLIIGFVASLHAFTATSDPDASTTILPSLSQDSLIKAMQIILIGLALAIVPFLPMLARDLWNRNGRTAAQMAILGHEIGIARRQMAALQAQLPYRGLANSNSNSDSNSAGDIEMGILGSGTIGGGNVAGASGSGTGMNSLAGSTGTLGVMGMGMGVRVGSGDSIASAMHAILTHSISLQELRGLLSSEYEEVEGIVQMARAGRSRSCPLEAPWDVGRSE